MKRRLLWQIYPVFLIVMLLGLTAISVNVSVLLKDFYQTEKTAQLKRLAGVATHYFEGIVGADDFDRMQKACDELAAATQLRYTIIDLQGKVLADSDQNPRQMENHLLRPEVQAVLSDKVGSDIRYSRTLGQEMLYVGLPLQNQGQIVAVLRIAVPLVELKRATRSMILQIVRYGALIAVLLAVLSLLLSWKITRPLERLRDGARRFAEGDLNHRLPVSTSREIGALAESMNRMAGELDKRIRTVVTQKNEQQAVLSSMIEGVLAVDTRGCVMSLNAAAARMIQVATDQAPGRTIEEVVRNTELQHFVLAALKSPEPIEDRLILHDASQAEHHLQVHGTPLLGDSGDAIGALIVLNDITRIHRLEQIRRDFVANVSHELKTPVTSIKGFIETLLDGAMDKPENRRRFLEIISRQAQRLDSIIDDLLMLSRIEQQHDAKQVERAPVKIREILNAAAELCEVAAAEKKIHIAVACPDTLEACVNASLAEQAVVNLIDNAVKYSEPGQEVSVAAHVENQNLLIHVRDHGCGIAREHLPRLFERFYRVDKARSRKLGGTGLGLAIVKHIAQYHAGYVTVDSQVGQGSTFTLHLPGNVAV